MIKKKKIFNAFTLVELIVVITILSILATIGYLSLLGYGVISRDTTRLSNVRSITKVVELYKLQEGVYPPVSNPINITFSGAVIWKQGSFGEETRKFAQRLSEVPIDPLTFSEFAYSKTISTGEYQVGAILEKESTLGKVNFGIGETHAVSSEFLKAFATTVTYGNYNGKFIVHKEDDNIYVLGVPSILSNEIGNVTLQELHTNQSFVYKGGPRAPSTYSGSVIDQGNWDFNPTDVTGDISLIYTGSIDDINSGSGKIDLVNNLKTYYTGTDVETSSDFDELLLVNPTSYPKQAIKLVNTFMESGIGGLGGESFLLSDIPSGGESTGVLCLFGSTNIAECDFG